MNIFYKVLFIVVSIHLSQCYSYHYKYSDKISENNDNEFTWLVVVRDKDDDGMYKISYGSLIHYRAVLTSAQAIRGYSAENITIEAKCKLATEINDQEIPYLMDCMSRDVKKIIYQNSIHNKNSKKRYVILMLKEAFKPTDRISFVNIATSLDNIDKKNCFIPRWIRFYKNSSGHKGLFTALYNKDISREHWNSKFLDPRQFRTNADDIIEDKFHELSDNNSSTLSYEYDELEMKIKTDRLNLLGSPFLCKLQEKSEYVQVGIATFRFLINTFEFMPETFNIRQYGSLFIIYQLRDEIMATIHENLLVCRNVCRKTCSIDFN